MHIDISQHSHSISCHLPQCFADKLDDDDNVVHVNKIKERVQKFVFGSVFVVKSFHDCISEAISNHNWTIMH